MSDGKSEFMTGTEIRMRQMADRPVVYIDASPGMQDAYMEVRRERARKFLKDIGDILNRPSSTPTIPE